MVDPKALEFALYCVEMYAQKHAVSGADVMKRFTAYGVLDFIDKHYEVLHTQGCEYILSEIDRYLGKEESAI